MTQTSITITGHLRAINQAQSLLRNEFIFPSDPEKSGTKYSITCMIASESLRNIQQIFKDHDARYGGGLTLEPC